MRRLLAALALGGLLLAGCGGGTIAPPAAAPAAPAHVTTIAEPAHLSVPAIDAESDLKAVGLGADGGIAVPPATEPLQGAWWTGSPRPGAVGPAVVLGHVDGQINGKAGQPGLFFKLKTLKVGDQAAITRTDGSVARFAVYDVVDAHKAQFPAGLVYGNTAGPELRLITCGGPWDAAAHSYRDNTVVFARLVT